MQRKEYGIYLFCFVLRVIKVQKLNLFRNTRFQFDNMS